jgi:small subunit ribosomal protein S17
MSETNTPSSRPLLGTKIGVVTSDKRNKSRTVAVDYQVRHPKYGKYLKRSQKFQVHDEDNASKQGDRVQIASCRPLSKTKAWRLVRVVESAPEQVAHATTATPEEVPAEASAE